MITSAVSNGFYEVAHVPYQSKIEAILVADQIGSNPSFNFHDDVYGKFNWNAEPTETLDQLYLARVIELRNKYDYLVLHYSGGADSNNILETCVRNNIELDEVFMRGPLGHADKNIKNTSPGNMYAEIFFNAIPIVTHVKNTHMPNLKIRVVDNTEYVLKFASSEKQVEDMFDPLSMGIGSISPNLLAGKDLDSLVPDYRKIAESGKKIGHVMGVDKPRLFIENGEFVVDFLDKSIQHMITHRAAKIDLPVYKELFYWGESTAPIIIKQSHTIKNYIKTRKLEEKYASASRNRAFHDFVSGLIYQPRMFPISFNSEKVFGISSLMPWDNYFLSDVNSAHYANWKKHATLLDQSIPERFKHSNSHFLNLQGILSKKYSIGF